MYILYLYSSVAKSSTGVFPKVHLIRLEIKERSKSNVTNVAIRNVAISRAQTRCTLLTTLFITISVIVTLKG